MFDDERDDYGFWADEPTRPLERITARRKPAGPAPVQPTRPHTARAADDASPTQPLRRPRPAHPQIGTRTHGNTQQLPVVTSETVATSGDGSSTRGLMLVDPLLRRIGALAVAVALFIPVALALRGNDDNRAAIEPSATALTIAATAAPAVAAADDTTTTIDIEALPPATPVNKSASTDGTATGDAGTAAPTATDAAAATTAPPSASQPPAAEAATPSAACKKYTVVAGDYWILIAKKVSVSVGDLLGANKATASTALFPGGVICLPANASAPTTAAPTTAAPTTVKATTTTVPATTTTVKATTTTAGGSQVPVKKTYTRAEVEAIIRSVWPDNLEDEAVRIATRESNLQPGVRNFCCYGLFQIYFNVHKVWLAQSGVTTAEQLYDPLTNAYIAYALYLKAGGWGPWKL